MPFGSALGRPEPTCQTGGGALEVPDSPTTGPGPTREADWGCRTSTHLLQAASWHSPGRVQALERPEGASPTHRSAVADRRTPAGPPRAHQQPPWSFAEPAAQRHARDGSPWPSWCWPAPPPPVRRCADFPPGSGCPLASLLPARSTHNPRLPPWHPPAVHLSHRPRHQGDRRRHAAADPGHRGRRRRHDPPARHRRP